MFLLFFSVSTHTSKGKTWGPSTSSPRTRNIIQNIPELRLASMDLCKSAPSLIKQPKTQLKHHSEKEVIKSGFLAARSESTISTNPLETFQDINDSLEKLNSAHNALPESVFSDKKRINSEKEKILFTKSTDNCSISSKPNNRFTKLFHAKMVNTSEKTSFLRNFNIPKSKHSCDFKPKPQKYEADVENSDKAQLFSNAVESTNYPLIDNSTEPLSDKNDKRIYTVFRKLKFPSVGKSKSQKNSSLSKCKINDSVKIVDTNTD